MSVANLNISVTEKRMLSDAEAATYCGLPSKLFKAVCPVPQVRLGQNLTRFDKRDLDTWLDAQKDEGQDTSRAAILGRLG